MSKKNLSLYRLCLKSGTLLQQKLSFVIKVGNNFEKKINTYFIPSDKQRYNYDLILQKSPDSDIMIHCQIGNQLLGTAILKVDSRKTQQPNQSLSVMNSKKQKIGVIDCSLKKIQKKTKKPPITIQIIQASYTQQQKDQNIKSFTVLKYGDANFQTKPTFNTIDNAPVWKQKFHSDQSYSDRIFVQLYQLINQKNKFIGIALIDLIKAIGYEKDYEIVFDKKIKGTIKISINQGKEKQVDIKINDKNFVRKRTIKVCVLETLLKNISKKGAFIRLLSSNTQQKFQTSHTFQSSKQLGFNQAFTMIVEQNEQIQAYLIINDEIQQQIARTSIKVTTIQNKKYQLKLQQPSQKQIGTLYLQFYDSQLDIKQQLPFNTKPISSPTKQNNLTPKTMQKLTQTNQILKNRYATRQSIHQYMNQVNNVLQKGLLKIAKERPENPVKELGLFLINYRQT